jgi:predicted transcriptional regulator
LPGSEFGSKNVFILVAACCINEIRKLSGGKKAIMNTEDPERDGDLRPVTKIIASYVGNHTLSPDQLPALITSVQQALRDLGKPAPTPAPRTPAVPIRRSVQHDHVVCLECGFRGKTLRRHLGTRHGLQTAEYLRRWDLATDHPLTAPAYSEQRSTMAKELGLGRKRNRPRGRTRRPKA